MVDSHWLGEFLAQCFEECGKPQRMIVEVWLEHPYTDYDEEHLVSTSHDETTNRDTEASFELYNWQKGSRHSAKAVRALRELFQLDSVEMIRIELRGGGDPSGRDLTTQLKAREIARVVRRLMQHYSGPRQVQVTKRVHIDEVCSLPPKDITSWWHQPSDAAQRRLIRGEASFEEMMQVQVEEWTRSRSSIVTADSSRISLL